MFFLRPKKRFFDSNHFSELQVVCGEQEKFQEEMGIVDARNMVHKVASKLVEPIILETVAKRCGELPSGKFRDENGICKDFSWIYANANKYRFRSTS